MQNKSENQTLINGRNHHGMTPLHLASGSGQLNVVKALIENGAEVNAGNAFGTSVLEWAAINGKVDVIKVLVANGANINQKDGGGSTPFLEAARRGNLRKKFTSKTQKFNPFQFKFLFCQTFCLKFAEFHRLFDGWTIVCYILFPFR